MVIFFSAGTKIFSFFLFLTRVHAQFERAAINHTPPQGPRSRLHFGPIFFKACPRTPPSLPAHASQIHPLQNAERQPKCTISTEVWPSCYKGIMFQTLSSWSGESPSSRLPFLPKIHPKKSPRLPFTAPPPPGAPQLSV